MSVRLVDLNPDFVDGTRIELDCPCGCANRLYVPFDVALDGTPGWNSGGWHREGDTFETLTLTPSILRRKFSCVNEWHGFITDGEVITV